MAETHTLKPAKSAFVWYRLFIRAIAVFAIFSVLSVIFSAFLLYFLVGYVLIFVFLWYQLSVCYRKENYIFYHDRMVRKGGGIFHDRKTELVVRNVTHVTASLPFIENKFFGTGNVRIESAGSGDSEIMLRSVADPLVYYKYVEKIMKGNGFGLSREKIIQKERPCGLGVFFETVAGPNNSLISVFVIVLYLMFNLRSFLSSSAVSLNFPVVALLFCFIVIPIFVIRYLNIKWRLYEIYDGVIVYSEGFLTKNYSFIPMENVSDSSLDQTLIEKIFGIYDVKVSCQGTGQEIHFRNIKNGRKMEKVIDELIQGAKSIRKVVVKKGETAALKVKKVSKKIDTDTGYTSNMRMNMKRTLMPTFILFVPFIVISFFAELSFIIWMWFFWFGITVSGIIAVKATEFVVKGKSIEKRFNFLSRKNVEFSCDKIMGINVKESFVDKWFGTVSIVFWSIGTGENIVFQYVNKKADLIEKLVSKAGIKSNDVVYKMNSEFSFGRMIKSSLFSNIFIVLVMVVFVVLAVATSAYFIGIFIFILVMYVFAAIYLPIHYGRSKLKFYKDYVYFEKGVFFRNYYFSLFDNIKDTESVRYIMSKHGAVRFNVAGESRIEKGKKKGAVVSNGFGISYIDAIDVKNDLIDLIFKKRPTKNEASNIEKNIGDYVFRDGIVARPDIGPSVFMAILISIVIFPLIVLLPINLLFTIWSVRVRKYLLQDGRIVSRWGIFYKRQLLVLYSKIDHVNSSEGFLNKMFHNGNVSVNTTGSSASELVVRDISGYGEFYEELREDVR